MVSQITGNPTFFQQLTHDNNRETSKQYIIGTLWGEYADRRRIPLTKGQ